MLEETSGCTTSPTADTNAKWNSERSGQIIHCAQGPVVQKGRRLSSLISTPRAQLCQPRCCDAAIAVRLLVTTWQNRLALGTRRLASWVGKHSSMALHAWGGRWDHCPLTWAAQQRWKMEQWWLGNASWCPSSVPWADHSTQEAGSSLSLSHPSPPLCFAAERSCTSSGWGPHALSAFPAAMKCNKRERSTREAWHKQRALHHFSELLLTWLRSHTDLRETWLTLCSQLNESETVRQGLNS